MRLGFLGTGTITSAMVTGLCSAAGAARAIRLSPRNPEVAAGLAGRFSAVSVAESNQQVVDDCETVVIAVRPQIAQSVLSELHFHAGQHILSVVSGFAVKRLAGLVAPATRITRAVPLPMAARRRCPTGIYPPDREAFELFSELGAAFEVATEDEFSAVCSSTATMAAYFAFADCIASWQARQGIPAQEARDYVARIFAGLADTAVDEPERSFESLAVDHATRGGTNEQLLNQLKADGVFESLSAALDGIMRRVTAAALFSDPNQNTR